MCIDKVEYDCWSHNGENYYSDFESARDHLNVGDTIYEGVQVEPKVSNFVDADGIIESIQESAYDNHDECAEDYLSDVTKEAKNELHDLVVGWLGKYGKTNFYSVSNVNERPLTEDDF